MMMTVAAVSLLCLVPQTQVDCNRGTQQIVCATPFAGDKPSILSEKPLTIEQLIHFCPSTYEDKFDFNGAQAHWWYL